MAVITISRQYGTGGIFIARQLAEKLRHDFLGREEFVEACNRKGLNLDLEKIEGRAPTILERTFGVKKDRLREVLSEAMNEAADRGDVVVGGWGGTGAPPGAHRRPPPANRRQRGGAHPPFHGVVRRVENGRRGDHQARRPGSGTVLPILLQRGFRRFHHLPRHAEHRANRPGEHRRLDRVDDRRKGRGGFLIRGRDFLSRDFPAPSLPPTPGEKAPRPGPAGARAPGRRSRGTITPFFFPLPRTPPAPPGSRAPERAARA